jgi:ArsR family transcriptional regulator, arsenate/arsenite/antimonite-responsive transcriptional repressor
MDTIKTLKSLSDPVRLNMVAKILECDGTTSCAVVSACQDLSQPAISHHLGKLVEAGILLEQKQGTAKSYRVDTPALEKMGIDIHKLTKGE